MGWTVRRSNRGGVRFSAVQTGLVAHPASCTMDTGSFPGVESGRGHDADSSPPSIAEVWKQSRAITLFSLRAFVAYEKGCNIPPSHIQTSNVVHWAVILQMLYFVYQMPFVANSWIITRIRWRLNEAVLRLELTLNFVSIMMMDWRCWGRCYCSHGYLSAIARWNQPTISPSSTLPRRLSITGSTASGWTV